MKSFTSLKTLTLVLLLVFTIGVQNSFAQYTIKDSDVQISGGVISSCIYNFAVTDIVIPDTLQGQKVIGIANASAYNTGAFYDKGITSISFPITIEFIGNNSFRQNPITNLDFSNFAALTTFGEYAFVSSSSLTSLNLTNCTALTSIGKGAFQQGGLITVDFTGCTSLQTLESSAFYTNSIASLDFSDCSALTTIKDRAFFTNSISSINFSGCTALDKFEDYAFSHNLLTSIDITGCTGLTSIGVSVFNYNSISSFVLPVVTLYENLGWRNGSNATFAGGETVTNLVTNYFARLLYTLTDADVVVADGIITSCLYSFSSKDIIIPDTLDGLAVTGIGESVFYNKTLFSIQFPTTLETIGKIAFSGNVLKSVDFSVCPSLKSIGDQAFYYNSINDVNFTGCSSLLSIGTNAFNYRNAISALDLSSCLSLKTIGTSAFQNNPITTLNLTNCLALERIYDNAFTSNSLTSLDLSDCSSLVFLGYAALYGANLSSFVLPSVAGYETFKWRDRDGNIFTQGETVTQLYTSYKLALPYTLIDDDVVISDNIINSCSYDFFYTDIIIPDTLQGQAVYGILDGTSSTGVFKSKKITSIQLPTTLKSIGNYAFYFNAIDSLDFSNCQMLVSVGDYAFNNNSLEKVNFTGCDSLQTIGNYSFYYNNKITALDFSSCTQLATIGNSAFMDNSISSINFANCSKLTSIGAGAFLRNSIPNLDLTDCTSLTSLGNYAFANNSISSLDISGCTSLLYIGTECFLNNSLSGFTLPVVTGYETNGWRDGNSIVYTGGQTTTNFSTYYKVPVPYTLTDDDVVVTDNEIKSCSYNFASKDIIIPDTLDGQAVTGIASKIYSQGIFKDKSIFTVQLPTTLVKIGDYAFYNNKISELDLSRCPSLTSIEFRVFEENLLDTITFTGCTELVTIGASAFKDNKIRNLDFSTCSKLATIGNNSFETNYSLISVNLSGCSALKTIGSYAFNGTKVATLDLTGCANLITFGGYAFSSTLLTELNLTDCSSLSTIGSNAFRNNKFTSLNLSANKSLKRIETSAFQSTLLSTLDISGCDSLIYIGNWSFDGTSLTGITLPTPLGYETLGWRDYNNNIFQAGETVTNFNTLYEVPIPYTLTDDDVVVTNGIITSCSYNFAFKDIVVPDTLDGQAVTAFNDATNGSGIFYNKGIKTLKLPSTLERIGNYSCNNNSALYILNLSECSSLKSIGNSAFRSSSNIPYLDLSACTSLSSIESYAFYSCNLDSINLSNCDSLLTIGSYAFKYNDLTSLNLTGCSSLKSIGDYAFQNNDLAKLELSGCNKLESIGTYAFAYCPLTSIDLSVCPALAYIGAYTFYGTSFTSFALPSVTSFEQYGWRDAGYNFYASGATVTNLAIWYKAAIPYTLTDDDVVVTNGEILSCSYNFAVKDIIIPDTLDGQAITGIASVSPGVFYNKGITSVKIPSLIETIGEYAFYHNSLFTLDLSSYTQLVSIDIYAFSYNNLKSVDLSGCSAITDINKQSFYHNNISDLNLTGCSALTTIGEMAFRENSLSTLDLSDCTALTSIESRAFYINSLSGFALPTVTGFEQFGWKDGNGNLYQGGDIVTNVDTYYKVPLPHTLTDADVVVTDGMITSCSYNFAKKDIIIPDTLDSQAISGIGSGVFQNKGITTIQLPDSIEIIGSSAFHTNSLFTIDLTSCKKLTTIGYAAFTTNISLSGVDLSQCSSLIYIGQYAFNNTATSSFVLPVNTNYQNLGWVDTNGTTYTGGQIVTNRSIWYKVPVPYTLTDDDVVVTNSEIISCSYNFETTDIIIPDTLDGQAVTGIIGNITSTSAIFYNKGITSLQLPATLKHIGENSFYFNQISRLNLSECDSLKTIGKSAFNDNYKLKTLELSGCTELISIGQSAFRNNSLNSINFSGCSSLTIIDNYAFYNNSLDSLILWDCTALKTIGDEAFRENQLPEINLDSCTSLTSIGRTAFYGNLLNSFKLPVIPVWEEYGWRDGDGNLFVGGETVSVLNTSYNVPIPYTLTDDDVVVTNGLIISCSYNFEFTDIIIPDTLDTQAVIGIANPPSYSMGIFTNKNITSLQLPINLEFIGDFAFSSNSIYNLILTGSALETIGNYAFSSNKIDSLDLSQCSSLTSIGERAFYYNSLTELDLSSCPNLSVIGVNAFYNNNIVSLNLSGCGALATISQNAFQSNNIDNLDLSACTSLTSIGVNAFTGNSITGFVLPKTNIPGFTLVHWLDGNNAQHAGGEFVTNFNITYSAVLAQAILATFNVSDGTNPLEGVTIALHGYDTIATDLNGIAEFTVMTNDSIGYTASASAYITINDSIAAVDSFVVENVIMISCSDSIVLNESICEGEQITIGDSTYSENGIFTTILTNELGCDSVITLNLIVNPIDYLDITDTLCFGEEISIGDTAYNESGIYVVNLTNQSGCDSVITLVLTVNPADSVTLNEIICEGEQISIGDSAHYSQTGVFTTTLQNLFGCDSTIILDLTVLPSETSLTKIICEGEFVSLGDSTYTQTGIYIDTLKNQLACDSIVTLNLTVIPEYTNLNQTLCMGDTAFIAHKFYTQTGVYTDTLSNQIGCDSIIVLDLIVNRTDSVNLSEVICEGEAVQVGDSIYTQTGNYQNNLLNSFGCDSVVSLDLTVNPSHNFEISEEICEGENYLFQEIYYDVQGTYSDTFSNQYGCDSIYTLNLIVNPTDRLLIRDTINYGETYSFRGNDYSTSGLYTDTLSNQLGCDSITSLLLFVYFEPIVYIPDSIFKAALLNDSLINTNSDDEIQVSEANSHLGSIVVNGLSIESLIGIEAFVNIDSLNCENNKLDSLDLSQNSVLTFVNFASNTIAYLNIYNLNELKFINGSANSLSILNTGSNSKLEEINCSDNQFTSLNFSQNNTLTNINCSNNLLTELDLRNGNNTNLSILSTGNTNLTCVCVNNVEYSNTNWTGLFDAGTVFSTDCNAPDISVNNITFIPSLVSPGDTLHVSWDVINYGGADAVGGWEERVSLVSGTGQQVYLNGNLKWSNTLLATDTITRNASLEIPEITYFSGPAYVMIELVPNAQIEALESITTNNSLVSGDALTLNEIISLHIPETSVSEDIGNSIRCYAKRSGNSDNILTVFLSASSNDVALPDSVDIQTGSNAQAFDLVIIDNNLFDGNRSVEIVASTVNLNDTSAIIEIIDDDVPDLAISINHDTVSEGDILDVLISSNKTSDTTQVVGLSSNKNSQWNFPINVSIPANQSSVSIQVEVTNDNAPELKAEAWLSVSAKGYNSASDTVLIIDDDFPEINLAILPDTVSESAGDNAVKGIITRMSDNDDVITISLSSTLSNELSLPEMVHFFSGEMEKQFDIDIIDNSIVDGFRTSEITAAVYIPSCSCISDTENGEIATATLVLADDDGPSLRLTCEPLILAEGASNIATLTVSRNTSTESSLFVHLTSNNPSEILLQDTVTISAGELSVDVPVNAINDSTDDGQQTVTIQASATNFSPGTINVFTSDQNKPDLTIQAFATNTNTVVLKQQLELNATIYNSGLLNASSGLFVKLYLSTDTKLDSWDELLESYVLTDGIPLGDSISFWELATMPDKIGDYYLILSINPDKIVSELLYINNESEAIPIQLVPDFTLTAVVAEETFTSAQPVTITGTATMGNGSPAPNKNIEVYIITQGIRRTVEATTDDNGNYSIIFEPGLNEVGHYLVGACSPGEGLSVTQDEFDIMGFATTLNNWLIWYVEKGSSITGTIEIKNFSDADLTNLTFNLLGVPPGLDLQINTIPTLSGNATAQFSYTITGTQVTEGFDYLHLPVEITSNQGVSFNFKVLYFCQAKEGLLKTEPVNLETSFTKGKTRYVEFYIYNVGAGNSGEINIVLPNVNWMSLASSSTIENIASGESAKVTLRLNSADDTELNFPMTGNIAINATNCDGIPLPYCIECVSEETGGLIVDVVDEYTYSTAEAPHLANAQVKITNPYTGIIVGEGNTNADGLIEFTDIPEGIYELLVQAHQHDGYKKTIIINPGMVTGELVFISFQAISYIWTVVPTEIEDEYKIELVIEYETNVPKPVVELEMPATMPDIESDETYSFLVTLTNHGLITAEDVDLSFPDDDPEYEFIFQDKKYEIPAKQSIQIPVLMQFKNQLKSAGINNQVNAKNGTTAIELKCVDYSGYEYGWQCGPTKKYEMYKRPYKYSRCTEKNDDDDDGNSGGGDDDDNKYDPGDLTDFTGKTTLFPPNIFGSGGGTGVPVLDDIVAAISADSGDSGYDPNSSDLACDPCKSNILLTIGGCIPGIDVAFSVMSCMYSYSDSQMTEDEIVACIIGFIPIAGCINGIINTAITCYGDPSGVKSASIDPIKPPMPPILREAITNLVYVQDAIEAKRDYLDEFWGSIDYRNKNNITNFSEEIKVFISGKIKFLPEDIITIKQNMTGTDISDLEIDAFTSRWNESVNAWGNNVFVPNTQYPNILNNNISDLCISKFDSVSNYALSKGFLSLNELYDDAMITVQEQIDDNQNSVCASVKLSISQKLVMTREAFRGTLSIYNGHETAAMEEFELNLEITNESGANCNDLFHIETEALAILTGINGTGVLDAQETGTATVLFIPEKEAAPTITQSYSFGGSISYIDPFTKTRVTKDLFPVTLEVHPSPDLYLHYFMQRDILGDDPLTENIVEPSIPGELALMIENNGFGDAKNILIESAQPEIIDNEKGLLIEFQLVGSNLQGYPVNMGLININFGTVAAQSTKVGQWWFTSSLLGHFVNYEANLTHVDSRGNPNLSLISGATLHELVKSISVYGALDDNIPDFLVNEVQDKDELPDAIYLSQGNTVLDVYEATFGSFDVPVGTPDFTNVLTLSPKLIGWNYIKLDDPGNGQFEISSVTRNNDGQEIPLSNVWLTTITMPDGEEHIYENKFHIVDDFETMTAQSYTIVWIPKDSVAVEIVEIKGAPEQMTTTPVSELVVVFSKQIDLSSFTFEDITIQHEYGANLSDNSISITQIDATSYRINFSALTSGDGLYSVTVQTININDLAGNGGLNGKMVSWVQALSVPAVEEFIGVPAMATNQLFNSIQLRFNTEIDVSTLTPERFVLERNGTAISTSLFIYPADNSFTLFTVINIESAMAQDGDYKLWIDVSEIRSLTGLFGLDVQYAEWTIDNTPPELLTIIEIDEEKLDKQHVSKLQLDFSEPVSDPDHSTIELWKNNVPVDITQIEIHAISATSYIISNFGMSTYNEGEYTFVVKTNQLTDIAGNFGSTNTSYLWTVDRTPPPAVSNLAIIPDLGISNSDHITTNDSLTIVMTVNEDKTNIKLFEVDGNNKVLIKELTNVNSGLLSIPAQFPNGGQVNTEIECSDSLGNAVVSPFGFYIDKTELYATISGAPILLAEKHPDSLIVEFSEEILAADFTNNTLSVKYNGTPISSSAITIAALSNTVFTLKGFDALSLQNGQYSLSIDLTQISKLISGKFGGNTVSTNWDIEIPNAPPIANAGSDANVRQGQFYTFDASATIDPDGDSISFSWYAPAGIALLTPNSPSPSFIVPPDSIGTTYSFMLAVSDGKLTHTDKSIVNINKLLIEDNINATICNGEEYNLGIQTLISTGIYTEIFKANDGADSTVILSLTVNPIDSVEISEVICEGEQTDVGDSTYSETGIFVTTLNNIYGCDSVVTLDLTVNPVDSVELSIVICEGEQTDIGDSTYTETGIFVTTLNNIYGCDSVVTLNLTVNPIDSVEISEVICEGEQVDVGDSTYTESGIFVTTLNNQFGCDSVVTLDLTVNPVDSVETTEVICEGEQVDVGDSTYTETGIFVTMLNNQFGCDSVVTLDLTVNLKDETVLNKTICEGESFTMGGQSYSTTDNYSITLTNKNGCDSVVTLDLTVNLKDETVLNKTICEGESFIMGGQSYSTTGKYSISLTNKNGCDSVVTLDLTVNLKDETVLNKTICEGKSFAMGGTDYSTTGTYATVLTNQNGCDSVVTLNLTVNPESSTELTKVICHGESVTVGSSTYTETGTFVTTLTNQFGCDSVVTLNLTVNPIFEITLNDTISEGEFYTLNGTDYETTGTYTASLNSQFGCDSTVTLNLEVVSNKPPRLIEPQNDFEVKAGDTISVTLDLSTAFSDPDGTILNYNYKFEAGQNPDWISYTFEDSLLFINIAPLSEDTGCYNLTIDAIDNLGLSVTDTFILCVVKNITNIDDVNLQSYNITLYPNPTNGESILDFNQEFTGEAELKITDLNGRQVFRKVYTGTTNQILFDISQHKSGMYIVTLLFDDRYIIKKLIVK